jgi:hypothetical protein
MNYNSPRWQAFRRRVPFRVRWFIALPVFALYLLAAIVAGIAAGCREFWRELWGEVSGCIKEYPSFWDGNR